MHSQQPSDYPKRILLAVTGLSPQIVTETVYALAMENPACTPTEIRLVTTADGAERARLALLSDEPGWFHRLRADYGLTPIRFDEDCIWIVRGADGSELADIRSPQDNLMCADFITDQVRVLTARDDVALHVSIAGGRKTMGFFLGYALSLFGRPQDRLSHVLVSEPFESSWNFFYPTPHSRVIETRDRQLADARDARVTLADIPFVSLRHGLPKALLEGRASYRDTVTAAQAGLTPPRLLIDLGTRTVQAAEQACTLPPAELALLTVFARRAQRGEPALAAPTKLVRDAEWAERYLDELRRITGMMGEITATERALRDGMDGDYFSQRLSKLRRLMRDCLGHRAAPYLIDDGGSRPRRYALALPPDAVIVRGRPRD